MLLNYDANAISMQRSCNQEDSNYLQLFETKFSKTRIKSEY